MARGSAGVAELVAIMEQQPCISVESFETFARRKAGVSFEGQPWSVAKLATVHVAQMDSHVTLQEAIMILGQIYEIASRKRDVSAITVVRRRQLATLGAARS